MLTDLRYALRQLTKSPGFSLTVLLILALGIGAATIVFTIVDSVLLRPVEYPESDRLVVVRERSMPRFPQFSVSPGNYASFASEIEAFESTYATTGRLFNLTGRGDPVRVSALGASGRYFEVLKTPPFIGRAFGPAEDAPGKGNVVVLMHAFWQRQFGGRREIVGEAITLSGQSYTVIGVMGPDFRRGSTLDLIVPMALPTDQAGQRGGHYLSMVGRLKPDATLEQANAQLAAVTARLAREFPDSNAGWDAFAITMLENNTRSARTALYLLLGAVGAMLLIACANIANLMLARATVRHREISIRAALGASRWRTVRLLLTESLLLSLVGGALGVLAARWGLDLVLAFGGDALPRAAEIALDWRAIGATTALSVVTGIAFGLAPALAGVRVNLVDALKSGARTAGDSGMRWARSALVVIEMALALILLTCAGLLMRSFVTLVHTSPGFDPSGVAVASVALPESQYDTPEKQALFVEQVLANYRAVPGARFAAAAHAMPYVSGEWILSLEFEGRPAPKPGEGISVHYFAITPDYFRAMGVPLLRGRSFTAADRKDAPRVAIVSESFARQHFPSGEALGQRVAVGIGPQVWHEIVGIVGDIKHARVDVATMPQVYEPLAQQPFDTVAFAVRFDTPAAAAAAGGALKQGVLAVDPAQPVMLGRTLSGYVDETSARERFILGLFGVFAALAVLLAALGIYSVIAYGVAQRRAEFGVRVALGAMPADILRLVLATGGRLLALGVLLGLAGSLAASRLLESMLFRTNARDPLVLAAVAALLGAVALVACLVPARRAARIDPMTALRAE